MVWDHSLVVECVLWVRFVKTDCQICTRLGFNSRWSPFCSRIKNLMVFYTGMWYRGYYIALWLLKLGFESRHSLFARIAQR